VGHSCIRRAAVGMHLFIYNIDPISSDHINHLKMSLRTFQVKVPKEGVERWLNDWMRSGLADFPTDDSSKQVLQIIANLFKDYNSQVRSDYTMIAPLC